MAEERQVSNNEQSGRYELVVGGFTAIAAYRREADKVVFTHTVVPEELEGQGVGSALLKGALEDVRAQGLKIVPLCSFVERYVAKHPETQDLVA